MKPFDEIPIEEYFRYHPPVTQERIAKHETINQISLEFAKVVNSLVADEKCRMFAEFAIQQARMFANQGVTVDEIRHSQQNGLLRSRIDSIAD